MSRAICIRGTNREHFAFCKHEYNVTSSQNTTKFICFCRYTNISNYNYMFLAFLVAIKHNIIYDKLCWFSVDSNML